MTRQFAYEWITLCFLLSSFAGLTQAQFSKEPTNTSVSDGSEMVVLNCEAEDGSVIKSWFKDDVKIVEDFKKHIFTTSGLRIKSIVKSDAGRYYCKNGVSKSRVATLTVEYICKDKFQIKRSGAVFRDRNATLTCNCPAVPSPSYTWQKDGNTLLSFTGRDLVITNAQTSNDDGEYVCIANSRGKQATSLAHRVTVLNCSPAEVVGPPEKKIFFGVPKPLTVRCDASGDPTPTVKWYLSDKTELKNTSRISILSNGALHFKETTADDRQKYECVASNSCHDSDPAKTQLVLAETGTFSPINDVLSRVDGLVSITCNPPSDALPPIKNITWQQGDNSLPSNPRFKVIGNTLQIQKAQRADTGTYKCIAENIAGKTSVDVKVLVAVYPQVTQNPENVTITEGKQVKMECKFSGDPKPVITWEKDTKTLSSDTNIKITDSGNGSVLAINNTAGKNSGRYRCVATLKHISERTEEAMLFVREKIVLEKVGSAKFNKGTTAKLNCKMAKGSRPYDVRWTKQGLGSNLPPRMKVEDTKLIINNVKMDDSGVYSCYINNSISNGSLSFDIHIYKYAKIVLKPENVTVEMNGSALFNCKADGEPEPGILWYAYKVTETKKPWITISNFSNIERLDNKSIVIKNVQKKDETWYKCIAGNRGYIEEATAYLKIGSGTSTTTVPEDTDEHQSDNMGKTVGIAVGCAGAYIILVVGLMIYCKGRRARQNKNKLMVNGEDVPLKPEDNIDNVEVVKAPEAVQNAKEYPRGNLETLRTLGNGTYGNVFLAKAADITEGESTSIVVVQSLTSNDEAVKKDFMRRMEMLSLKHENIAKLLGVCREEDPMYAISEYPEQGDLKTVMRDSSSPLSPTQKLNICAAVASGMNYLTNHGYVHKDLAARNCLVNKAFNVKISFLSLNQGTYPKEYYNRKGELIPLRWMAPEALDGDYSDMSDVWAFGILMWEVYTEGVLPYEERPDEEVLHSVADDLRLTKPDGCPGKIYKMMEKCWADDKEDRLTFGELCEDISEIPRESEF